MFDGIAGRKKLSVLCLSLVLTWVSMPPAGASAFLLEADFGGLKTVDVSGAVPVVYGPFLTGGEFNNVRQVEMLRDEPVAIMRTDFDLIRVDLADPLAPKITARTKPPFEPKLLVAPGAADFFLLLGPTRELAVIDSATLAIRRTFLTPGLRDNAALMPGGKSLVSTGRSALGWPGNFVASFDQEAGLGPETSIEASVPSERFPICSPDGSTVTILQNGYLFGAPQPPGIPQFQLYLDGFEAGPAGLAHRQSLQPSGYFILDHVYSRLGAELVLFQVRLPHSGQEDRLLRFAASAPGRFEAMAPISLGFKSIGNLARAGGGRKIYFGTASGRPPALVFELHLYRPADGSLETFPVGLWLGSLQAFETGAAVFADGFESGDRTAWN